MSQLADIEKVVSTQPMNELEKALLFLEILEVLGWDIDGVTSAEDAILYLRGYR